MMGMMQLIDIAVAVAVAVARLFLIAKMSLY
jgi:hypothetical protein